MLSFRCQQQPHEYGMVCLCNEQLTVTAVMTKLVTPTNTDATRPSFTPADANIDVE